MLTGIKALLRAASNQAAREGSCGLSPGTFPAYVAFRAAGLKVGTGSDNIPPRKVAFFFL